jgi:acyl carrier protein
MTQVKVMNPANQIKLEEIFKFILDLEEGANISAIRKVAHPKWDSLAHTSLVAALESEFDIRLEVADMDRMTSFAATCLLLEEKGI